MSSTSDKTVTHHTLTERVERVADQVLSGERDVTPGIKDMSLTPLEQQRYEELAAIIKEAAARGEDYKQFTQDLWKFDYIRRPPDIQDFILNEYYLGRTWKPVPGENEGIWPAWLDLLDRHMNVNSRVHNMVLTGSLGAGKTAMMVTLILYRMCMATHLKNPQHFFGLNRNSNIVYNFLSVTKAAVKDTAFGDAMSYMSDSPYFLEVCHFDPDSDYSSYRIPMGNTLPDGSPSKIWLTAGSKGQHVLGRNLVGIGLDEGNFRLEKDPDMKAYALYDQVRTRIANRFQKIAGFLPALSCIASSAADESSFTEKVVGEIEEQNRQLDLANRQLPAGVEPEPRSQIVFRNAVYKIKRHALTGIGPDHHWFKVAYGLKNMEPYILSGWYREDGTPILSDPHEEPPQGAKTEMVPKFYLDAYRRNCKAQLQNLSGISVGGAHRLFPSAIDIEFCLQASVDEGIPDPMMPGVQRIPISSEDDKNVWDYLNHKSFLTRVQSKIQPIRHPQALRYAHIDLATQTMAGVSICHLAGSQRVDGLVKDGEPFSEYRLVVEYDFILTICAGQTKPINIGKIQKLFFWLRDMCGYRFGLITADMWNSAMPLQELEARGFKVGTLSIDRDKSVYTAWRAGFEEHRIRLPRNEQMLREAENLLEMDKKFDHPPDGSKDSCFALDQEIRLLSGKVVRIGDLVPGDEVWVFGIKDGQIKATKATALGITRRTASTVRVTLDNGKHVTCTPDHLFMLRDGSYCRADSLKYGDSLMPFYLDRLKKGYARVFNPATNCYELVYRLVDEQFNGKRPKGFTVHHKNHNKHDDQPPNLQRMTNAEHWALHRHIDGVDRIKTEEKRQHNLAVYNAKPETKAAARDRLAYARKFCDFKAIGSKNGQLAVKRFKSKAYRKHHAERIRALMKNDPAYKAASIKGILNANKKRKIAVDMLAVQRCREEGLTNYDIAEKMGITLSVLENRIKSAKKAGLKFKTDYTSARSMAHCKKRLDQVAQIEALRAAGSSIVKACAEAGTSYPTYKKWLTKSNHRVLSVEPHALMDVACLSTDTHNFALECGVFVHNCDGASGAYMNAICSDEKTGLISHNAPSLYTGQQMQQVQDEAPPIGIPLPASGYNRTKVFEV